MSNPTVPAAFVVPVEGIGVFTFARRSLGNQFRIESTYCRLTEGLALVTTFLGNLAQSVADLSVLTVSGPAGWSAADILEMDGGDPETYANIQKVWGALCDKEAEFRGGLQAQGPGQAGGDLAGTVVPPPLQPAADGPPLPRHDPGGH